MKFYITLLMSVCFFGANSASAQSSSKPFLVVQSMTYKGGVDVSSFGVPRNPLIYESMLLPSKTSDQMIEGEALKNLLDGLGSGPLPTVIDIERWHLYTDNEDERSKSREKYLNVVRNIRAARPGIKLGYYGVVPTRTYWPLLDAGRKSERQKWENLNSRAAQDFVPHVDAIFPSLYTLYGNQEGWRIYAEETLRVAKRFGKPVYCYLWPQFNSGNPLLGGKYLPADYWMLELETCYKHSDGIVIWNHEPQKNWDPDAEWWQQTLKFLESKSIKN
ncbi:hypothetical protein [Variovorax sp. OV700]|uniref:hypothetical protein n=1 Tax=Variovorax sp. OV700 TaxID=1882826 RepID=UPI000889F581|nr:hypothetical protein [Variovorax sp. OV700]SDH43599.1 hypothetical protein SAMN05444748_101342 [Variovorax sp. OV700]